MFLDERKIISAIVVASIILFGVVGWWFFLPKQGREVSASGTIEATEVVVSSKVSGNVLKLLVTEGDKVAKGNILAQIDNSELNALYRQAKANVTLAKNNLSRAKELSVSGFASQQALDEAKANYDAAAASEDLAVIRLKDATITSPVSGYVTVKSVEEGELVMTGSPIVTISDLSNVYMMVYVSENQVGKVKLGGKAYIFSDSYPNERFSGTVTYISQQAEFTPKTIQTKEERVTQVFGVKVEIPNPALKLKPGLPADADIDL